MAENENIARDTHFASFAALELERLAPDLSALFIALGSPLSSRAEEIESAKRLLRLVLAQCAYDLVYHALEMAKEHDLFADNFYGRFTLDTEARVTEIPDLTAWPNTSSEAP